MKRYIIAFLGMCVSLNAFTQVSQTVFSQFPPHIVYRIQEVSRLTTLSERSQMALARYFMKQDSLAALTLDRTGHSDSLHVFYRVNKALELKEVLQPLEYNSYCLKESPRSSSLLRHFIEKREPLQLSSSQVLDLLKESDRMERLRDQAVKDWRVQELKIADSLLTHSKVLDYFLQEQNKRATTTADKWMAEIMKNRLPIAGKPDALRDTFRLFEARAQAILAYQKIGSDKNQWAAAKKQYESSKPLPLKRLEAYKRLPSWSIVRMAINLNDSLQLKISISELDQMLKAFDSFEEKSKALKKGKKVYSVRGLEYQTILPILTVPRLEKILRNRVAAAVHKKVDKHLINLDKNKLLTSSNRFAIQKELVDYETKLAMAQEWVKMERSQEKLFRLYDVKDHIPEILKKLNNKRKEENIKGKDNRF